MRKRRTLILDLVFRIRIFIVKLVRGEQGTFSYEYGCMGTEKVIKIQGRGKGRGGMTMFLVSNYLFPHRRMRDVVYCLNSIPVYQCISDCSIPRQGGIQSPGSRIHVLVVRQRQHEKSIA